MIREKNFPISIAFCLSFLAFTFSGCSGASATAGSGTSGSTTPTANYLYAVTGSPNTTVTADETSSIYAYSINASTGALTELGAALLNLDPLSGAFFDSTDNRIFTYSEYTGVIGGYSVESSSGSLVSISGFPISTGDTYDQTPTYFSLPGILLLDGSNKFLRFVDDQTGYVVSGGTSATYPPSNISVYSLASSTGTPTLMGAYSTQGNNSFATAPVVVDPSGKFAYGYATEAGTSIAVYTVNPTTGMLTAGSTVTSTCDLSSIVIDPQSKFLYCVTQGETSVLAYTINLTSGALTAVATYPVSGLGSSSTQVVIEPEERFLYAATSSGYEIYAINSSTGALTQTGTASNVSVLTFDSTGSLAFAATGTSIGSFTVNATTAALTQESTYAQPTSYGIAHLFVTTL